MNCTFEYCKPLINCSSTAGDDVEGAAEVEGEDSMREMDADFMIVEDSSDSEEEESVEVCLEGRGALHVQMDAYAYLKDIRHVECFYHTHI